MATGNFFFEHRCIVVTNDDIDFGNVPTYEWQRHDRCVLTDYDDLECYDITLTAGYYEAACIDYELKNDFDFIGQFFGWSYDPQSKAEIARDFAEDYGYIYHRSAETLRKVMNGAKTIDDAIYKLEEYILALEEKKANKIIDGIKQYYGYEEYAVRARFSNGETIYQKVG